MRITETMRYHNLLRDVSNAQRRLAETQDQVASGKKVAKPSDDPVAAADILRVRTEQSEGSQYERNLTFAKSKLEYTEGILDSVAQVMERAVTVGQTSLSNPETAGVFVAELQGLRDQLLSAANSTYAGRYVFGGNQTTQAPFVKNPDGSVTFQGNSDGMALEINRGVELNTQLSGPEVFSGANDAFRTINDLVTAIQSGDKTAIDAQVRKLDGATENVWLAQTKVGNYLNRAAGVADDLASSKLSREKELSEKEAADLASAIAEMLTSQQGLQATLTVGANFSKLTILDYLR